MSGLPKEIFVVVAESDFYMSDKQRGVPIAFESEALDLEEKYLDIPIAAIKTIKEKYIRVY